MDPHEAKTDIFPHRVLAESRIDLLFEATQEAVLDALAAADTTRGRNGNKRQGLRDLRVREA
ncbi:MAG: hypothetical protein JO172_10930 [Hyphomicrobiales bacterium]|nr:hypothetical protein [Hyphomicrobiales bacterium]